MAMLASHVASVLGQGEQFALRGEDQLLTAVCVDSRHLFIPQETLFIALKGKYVDGHDFIADVYAQGVRHFIVTEAHFQTSPYAKDSHFFCVPNALKALQNIAQHYRASLEKTQLISITGSVGKTVVKEWLFDFFHTKGESAYRSTRSYNSQLGVPLSLMGIDARHRVAIIEAGISQPKEMETLRKMIAPNVGVLSTIDDTHSEHFVSMEEKIKEKCKLFEGCERIVCSDENLAFPYVKRHHADKVLYWSRHDRSALVVVEALERYDKYSSLKLNIHGEVIDVHVPFLDKAEVENTLLCLTTLVALGQDMQRIRDYIKHLQAVSVYWTMSELDYNSYLIYDVQHADLHSLSIALSKIKQQTRFEKCTIILSDLQLDAWQCSPSLFKQMAHHFNSFSDVRLILVGHALLPQLKPYLNLNRVRLFSYANKQELLTDFATFSFIDHAILVLAQKSFAFREVVERLEGTAHSTRLHIHLTTFKNNIATYKSYLKKNVKMMGMVKAFGYGSGAVEIAQQLQRQGVDYLGIAYVDEGILLRKAHIKVPMMVMNAEVQCIPTMVAYRLEPVIYSKEMLEPFLHYCRAHRIEDYPIHLEIETGMHRLGVERQEVDALLRRIATSKEVRLQSMFSHFCASEDPTQDAFSRLQFERLQSCVSNAKTLISYPFISHIANTSAIVRFPEYHLDMVRIGIGMYGFDSSAQKPRIQPMISLHSSIAQLKYLEVGDRIGYGNCVVKKPTKTATIRIGYADGFSRILGEGRGCVYIKNKKAPVLGRVCMDMTMVDVSDIADIQLGDKVEIFGNQYAFLEFCRTLEKSPYEVLSNFSTRVKRVYLEE